jgi:hypothetical protein
MLGIGVAWVRGVHWHLCVIGRHALRDSHVGSIRGLLHHHRSAIHKLRTTTLERSDMARLGPAVKLRDRLWEGKLGMGSHRGWVSMLHPRGRENLGVRRG